jgi:pilus assembly protein Flp/PilA
VLVNPVGWPVYRRVADTRNVSVLWEVVMLKDLVIRLVKEEEGASLVEYVLLAALIAVVCIGAITLVGTKAKAKFDDVSAAL